MDANIREELLTVVRNCINMLPHIFLLQSTVLMFIISSGSNLDEMLQMLVKKAWLLFYELILIKGIEFQITFIEVVTCGYKKPGLDNHSLLCTAT